MSSQCNYPINVVTYWIHQWQKGELIVTAKEFEQGIKTGLNKLSEQDIKQIRDEFNSEPDYPIPSQNPKK